MSLWAPEWYSRNLSDGVTRHLMFGDACLPLIFRTRRECRAEIVKRWGYILVRPDLRAEPHGWRLPKAVRVELVKVRGR